MATHLYDLLEYFAGPVRKVVAMTGNLVQSYKSEDSSTTLLEFQSGAHGTVDCFFCVPDEASRTRLEIYGSQGAILTEGTIGQSQGGKMEAYFSAAAGGYDAAQNKDVVRQFQPVEFDAINPYTAECEYFADCILQEHSPALNDGRHGVHIMEVTEKAYASYRDGRVEEMA
jgi:predicted dehydrogenase